MRESREATKARVRVIIRRLDRAYPDARFALDFTTPLELLVATILAAQCTDERVNQVTTSLFRSYRSAKDYAEADPPALETEVRSTGFYRTKTRSLIGMGARAGRAAGGRRSARPGCADRAARGRPQDGQRGARQRLWRAGNRRGHPRLPDRPAPGTRPRGRSRPHPRSAGRGGAARPLDPLLPSDPGARPGDVHGPQAGLPCLPDSRAVPLARQARRATRQAAAGTCPTSVPQVAVSLTQYERSAKVNLCVFRD